MSYSFNNQLKVLKAIEETCGLNGRDPIRISVPGVTSEEIALHCGVLSEIGLIKTHTLQGEYYDVYMPIRITWEGLQFLSEASRSFWKHAQQFGADMVEHYTGVNVTSAVECFRAALESFRRATPNV